MGGGGGPRGGIGGMPGGGGRIGGIGGPRIGPPIPGGPIRPGPMSVKAEYKHIRTSSRLKVHANHINHRNMQVSKLQESCCQDTTRFMQFIF